MISKKDLEALDCKTIEDYFKHITEVRNSGDIVGAHKKICKLNKPQLIQFYYFINEANIKAKHKDSFKNIIIELALNRNNQY